MGRRLYFLLPNIARARQMVDELLLTRIDDRHIHVMTKEGTPMRGPPEASLLQRSDLLHGLGTGLSVGSLTWILAGLVAIAFPSEGIQLGGWTLMVTAVSGAVMGAWLAGMMGTDIPNSQPKEFESAAEEGQVLMMIDVPKPRVKSVTNMIRRHHPEADTRGTESTIPAFP